MVPKASYVVVFRARLRGVPDDGYKQMAEQLRQRAESKYGCLAFYSCLEQGNEIALSYWRTLEDINRWKDDEMHKEAQTLGAKKWYSWYHVEINKLVRSYGSIGDDQ